jgi:hypothetical protein
VGGSLIACAAGCSFTPPRYWGEVAEDLSNVRGVYENVDYYGEVEVLWDTVAPQSRYAHWTLPDDCVSLEPDGEEILFRLWREGEVLDEVWRRYTRWPRFVELPKYTAAEWGFPFFMRRDQQVWLSIDDAGDLAVRLSKRSYDLLETDGGATLEMTYVRVGEPPP